MATNKKVNFKLLTLIATGLIVVGFIGSWLVGVGQNSGVTLEDTAVVNGVVDVQITTISQRINVVPIDGSEARVVSSGTPEDARLMVEVNDDVLTVETVYPRSSWGVNVRFTTLFNEQPTLTVYLPTQIYERIAINGTSGRIDISGFTTSKLQVDNMSGRIRVSDIEGDVDVNGTSGSIEVQNVTGNATVRGMSGSITVSNINGDTIVDGASGGITLSDIGGDIEVNNMSGSIRLNNDTIEQNVDLQTASGRIRVSLNRQPEHAQFNLSSLSGRTEIFGDRTTSASFGDGRYEVGLNTMSGRITVVE